MINSFSFPFSLNDAISLFVFQFHIEYLFFTQKAQKSRKFVCLAANGYRGLLFLFDIN